MTEEREKMRLLSELLKEEFARYTLRVTRAGGRIPSQGDFATWLDVSPTSLSYWINQIRPPSYDNLDKLATRLGKRIYEILMFPPGCRTISTSRSLRSVSRV